MKDRNDWIVNFLENQSVTLEDLEEFFTIENEDKPIVVKKVNSVWYSYTTDHYLYNIFLEKEIGNAKRYTIKEVEYVKKEN